MHIKLRPGKCDGSPISRAEGVTLYEGVKKFNLLKGLKLDYYSDLSVVDVLFQHQKMQNIFPAVLASNFFRINVHFLQTNIIFINWLLSR